MGIIVKSYLIRRKIRYYFYLIWNRIVFYLNNISYGKNLRIYNKFYLLKHPTACIEIGNNFIFTSGEAFNPLCRNIRGCIFADQNLKLKIGNNTGISSACIWVKESITIGSNVKIGGDCILMDTDAHNLNYEIRNGTITDEEGKSIDCKTANSKPIIIEDDVLIGTRCIILKGVTIGARTIIGSGSVVTKSIPPDVIAAGNPCKVIKALKS